MEVPDLDLPAAVRILDTYDSLQKTTNALTENNFKAKRDMQQQKPSFLFQLLQNLRDNNNLTNQMNSRNHKLRSCADWRRIRKPRESVKYFSNTDAC